MTCDEFRGIILGGKLPWELTVGELAVVASHPIECPKCEEWFEKALAETEPQTEEQKKEADRYYQLGENVAEEGANDPEYVEVIQKAQEKRRQNDL